eukprot:scaffold2504_cov94-Cylindrotheca_fusiformis.AAC.4
MIEPVLSLLFPQEILHHAMLDASFVMQLKAGVDRTRFMQRVSRMEMNLPAEQESSLLKRLFAPPFCFASFRL